MFAGIPYRGSPRCATEHEDAHTGPVVEARNLELRYPDLPMPAIRGVDFALNNGTHTVLVGPNGSGKSTLLKAAAGLLKPAQGALTVFGCPAHHCHASTCYLPQRSHVDWGFPMTLRQLVLTGSYVHLGWFARPAKPQRERAANAMRRLGLETLAERKIDQLSGGQQQRALLARALLHDAELYLLDEPFNGIDAETLDVLAAVLQALVDQGGTVLTSTHHADEVPIHFDHILHLEAGRITPGTGGAETG